MRNEKKGTARRSPEARPTRPRPFLLLIFFACGGVGGVQRGMSGCRPCLVRCGELRTLHQTALRCGLLWVGSSAGLTAGLWGWLWAGLSHRDAGQALVVTVVVRGS